MLGIRCADQHVLQCVCTHLIRLRECKPLGFFQELAGLPADSNATGALPALRLYFCGGRQRATAFGQPKFLLSVLAFQVGPWCWDCVAEVKCDLV